MCLDAFYYFLLLMNETEPLQDPAAGWMESSWNQAFSRLVQPDHFQWHDHQWLRPGWEYLTVYQLHASRLSNQFQQEPPLNRIAREIDSHAGYLRDLESPLSFCFRSTRLAPTTPGATIRRFSTRSKTTTVVRTPSRNWWTPAIKMDWL
jgi:hypothetical protein